VGEQEGRLNAEVASSQQAAQPAAPQTQPGKEEPEEEHEDQEQSALKEWVGLLVRAGIWALLIYLFIFQVSIVEGDSMNPTFSDGDKLVIDKLTYRFAPVGRFDVIVFESVDATKPPRRPRDYIKRLIGLPGETVAIHDGAVWINGRKLEDKFGPTFVNGSLDARESPAVSVPPGHYFVMGDNRLFSKDSRVQARQSLGYVDVRQVKGLVRLRFWPWREWKWFGRGQ
jgi:signal peptidase I